MKKKNYIEAQQTIIDLGLRNGVALDGGADAISKDGVDVIYAREERDWNTDSEWQNSSHNVWKQW